MKVIVAALVVFCFWSISLAESTVKVRQATIFGETIKIGQGADIVQSRIKADRFVTSGYNYGDISKGYYKDGGVTYVITYGPPNDGSGVYVVKQIEKTNQESSRLSAPASPTVVAPISPILTREQVIGLRRKYQVQVVSFDATQEFGAEFPYSDYVRLRITNRSGVTLKTLTVLTKRFDAAGRMIGASRAPAIPVADLKPDQTVEVDYYPRGHLHGVKKITVEIEDRISPEDAKFFSELQ